MERPRCCFILTYKWVSPNSHILWNDVGNGRHSAKLMPAGIQNNGRMQLIKQVLGGAALFGALVAMPAIAQPAQSAAAQQPQLTAQQQAMVASLVPVANGFINAIDRGQYDVALGLTAAQFRQSLGTAKLGDILTKAKADSGAATQRDLVNLEELTPPPEAKLPAGKYARATYQTIFAKTGPTIEAVILFQETPNNWKVSHYFAQPIPQQAPQQPAAAPKR